MKIDVKFMNTARCPGQKSSSAKIVAGPIVNAGKKYPYSMEAYNQALREYNNFVVSGKVPERLTIR
jgi:hypothetical protein